MLARADADNLLVLFGIPSSKNFLDALGFTFGVVDGHGANQLAIAGMTRNIENAVHDFNVARSCKKQHVPHITSPHNRDPFTITNTMFSNLALRHNPKYNRSGFFSRWAP